jgi:twinkle protein
VVTEGEFDAMAVHQETGLPCVSLPNGANSLPLSLLKFFDRFERIYLWLDADEVGQNAVEKFSNVSYHIPLLNVMSFMQKLGRNRTLIVNSRMNDPKGPKDANDALLQGIDLRQLIS